jgi:hypothetical protein
MTVLLKIFETYLDSSTSDTVRSDWIREAVVIFLGTLASYLKSDDPKVNVHCFSESVGIVTFFLHFLDCYDYWASCGCTEDTL